MTHEAGFLEALLADPDDTAARLIFADWLDEHDDPRGEFLRIQARLAAGVPDLAERSRLQQGERDWLARHGPGRLLGPLFGLCDGWRYEGGLGSLTLEARQFSSGRFAGRAADGLRAAWVRRVRLVGLHEYSRNRLPAVAATPALAAVVALDLARQELTDADLRTLLASPHLGRLRELDLSNNRLTDAAAAALLSWPGLGQLTALDLGNNALTGAGVRPLLAAPALAGLRSLGLRGNPLDADALEQLRRWSEQRAPLGPGGWPLRLVASLGLELSLVPAGCFLMGSPPPEPGPDAEREPEHAPEMPLHEVEITRPFYLGRLHVTQEQYRRLMPSNPSHFTPGSGGSGGLDDAADTRYWPVEMVSLPDAETFCARLSALPAERRAGRVYRLATEAEWEHACRAGTATLYSCGDQLTPDLARYDAGVGGRSPTRGGSYPANAFGLYDMHGNVWDWVADAYDAEYYRHSPRRDPPGPAQRGVYGVLRGGSWFNAAVYCRSAQRLRTTIDSGSFCIGFRVACSLPRGGDAADDTGFPTLGGRR